ncbi:LytR C-terminal domain-containing protein [Zeimonas arvi]|uniref:Tetratricopeptide repeat protein n=1 Tax=Zeimonas arvi TaxID=2498847 RepID=A0A5C8NYH6_9BURK|nr:tetratricopeptide repeat protein [Zeimonas arvi]TXL66055.1 tetratricopeptide repeat protein [Zeimonas arvi]
MNANRYPLLLGACAVALITGCAQTGMQGDSSQAAASKAGALRAKVEPVYRVQQPVGTAAGQYAVGRIDLGEGRHEAAIRRFKAALQLDPTFVEAHNGLGVAYGQIGRFAEAAEAFRAALASGPAQAHVMNNLGFAQFKAGQLDEAWISLRRAYDLDPQNAKTRENLVMLAEARQLAAAQAVKAPVAVAPMAVAAPTVPAAPIAAAPATAVAPVAAAAPLAAAAPVEQTPAPIVASQPAEIQTAPIVASRPVQVEPAPIVASAAAMPSASSVAEVPAEPPALAAAVPVVAAPVAATPVAATQAVAEPPVASPRPAVASVAPTESAPPAAALVAVAQAKAARVLGEAPNPRAYEIVVSRSSDTELVQLTPGVYELRSNAVAIAAPAVAEPLARAASPEQRPASRVAVRTPATPSANAVATAPQVAVAPVRTYRIEARVATVPEQPAVRPVAKVPAAPKALAPQPLASLKTVAGLEVSNGVGLRSLAGRTARQLERFGASVARVSDYRTYGKGRTEIHYLAGHAAGAKALQQRLPVEARLVEVSKMHPGVNVRLVVGRDMVAGPVAWWSEDPAVAESATMARAEQLAPPVIGLAPAVSGGVEASLAIAAPRGVELKPFAAKVARVDVEDGWRYL